MGSSTGDFEIWLKGALEVEWLSLWELCEGNREGGLPSGDPVRYVEKAPKTGNSFIGAPCSGNLEPIGDFGIWKDRGGGLR